MQWVESRSISEYQARVYAKHDDGAAVVFPPVAMALGYIRTYWLLSLLVSVPYAVPTKRKSLVMKQDIPILAVLGSDFIHSGF